MKGDDATEAALFWIVFGGGILSLLFVAVRGRAFHIVRLCVLVLLTACYAIYEHRMPIEMNIRLDAPFVLLPLIAAWLGLIISVALPTKKPQ
jgi:hypothetical protein